MTESGTNTVSVISTATNKITGTVVVGIYPHGIAITPDGKTAYVANTGPNTEPGGSQTVSVAGVASQSVSGTIKVGEAPQVVTISPDGSLVFVTCAHGVYDHRVERRGAQGRRGSHQPHSVTVTPDGTQAWVADSEQNRVFVLRTSCLRAVGQIPSGASCAGTRSRPLDSSGRSFPCRVRR